MSEVKVNKISPRSGTDVTLGDSGDTFTVPTGVTLDTSNSTVTLPDGSVTNAKLANSSITLNGNSVSLGGSASIASGMFRNIIINGDMSISQRGTSFTGLGDTNSQYTLDRFKWVEEGATDTAEYTVSQSTDVPTGQGFSKSLKIDCTTADTSVDANNIQYIGTAIEGQNLQYLKYGTSNAESTTLSFWVRSNKTGTYGVALISNDSTEYLYSQTYTINSADTWEKKTLTFVGDTSANFDDDNGNSLLIQWYLVAGTNKSSGSSQTWGSYTQANRAAGQTVNLADSTSNEWYITGIQLEAGTTASDFEFLPHDVNKNRCLRYYYVHAEGNAKQIGNAGYYSNSYITSSIQFPIEMRASPSVVTTSGTNYYNIYRNNASDNFDGTWGIQQPTTFAAGIDATTGASGTAGQYGRAVTNNASALVAFSSEL